MNCGWSPKIHPTVLRVLDKDPLRCMWWCLCRSCFCHVICSPSDETKLQYEVYLTLWDNLDIADRCRHFYSRAVLLFSSALWLFIISNLFIRLLLTLFPQLPQAKPCHPTRSVHKGLIRALKQGPIEIAQQSWMRWRSRPTLGRPAGLWNPPRARVLPHTHACYLCLNRCTFVCFWVNPSTSPLPCTPLTSPEGEDVFLSVWHNQSQRSSRMSHLRCVSPPSLFWKYLGDRWLLPFGLIRSN